MEEKKYNAADDIYSKILRAGRRTYFFDVRSTKAGDYYLTISESKKFTNEDGSFYFKKHKIYLYKEDFEGFTDLLNEMTKYILDEKGLPDSKNKPKVDINTERPNWGSYPIIFGEKL